MLPVRAQLPDGTKFQLFVHDERDRYISARIQRRGSWEPFVTAIMMSLLKPGDVFVDIGANIGWYTVASALRVGVTGRVIAFEPEPANADMLQRNVSLNALHNVRLFRCAVAETSGEMEMTKSTTNMGDHRIHEITGNSNAVAIPVDTLDRLIARNAIDLLKARIVKIDTQGAEVLVLQGAHDTLKSLSAECAVFIEFSPNLLRRHGEDVPGTFIRTILRMNKSVYLIHSRYRTLHRVSEEELTAFAETCRGGSDDAGLDLLLAPHHEAPLQRYCRFHAPLVRSKIIKRAG